MVVHMPRDAALHVVGSYQQLAPISSRQSQHSMLHLLPPASLRRSYATIAQHIEALKAEATVSSVMAQAALPCEALYTLKRSMQAVVMVQ